MTFVRKGGSLGQVKKSLSEKKLDGGVSLNPKGFYQNKLASSKMRKLKADKLTS